jgi:hypothetical protein
LDEENKKMSLVLGNEKPDAEALRQMRERGGSWAAYKCVALDASDLGDLRFLQFGEGRTFSEPPQRYPDTQFGIGWRYLLVGVVNLETGEIESLKENS